MLVWAIKVRFVRVWTRDGPCVGSGRGLNGGVLQSGASGRPPSDLLPRSEPLLVASHSEPDPSLAVRNDPDNLLSIALLLTSPCSPLCSPNPPRHSLLSLHSHASRTRQAHVLAPRLLYLLPTALVFACLYLYDGSTRFPCSALLVAVLAVDVLISPLALRRPLFLPLSPFPTRTLLLSTCPL